MMAQPPHLLLLLSMFISVAHGQTVLDDLSWTVAGFQMNATSPNFTNCQGETIYYTISTNSSGGFQSITGTTNTSVPSGVIFPATTGSSSVTTIPIIFNFNQSVSGLRIRFVDLDEDASPAYANPEETVTNFSTLPSNIASTLGTVNWNGTSMIPVGNNTNAWAEWNSEITTVSFTYTRPGTGYGLIIDAVEFICPEDTATIINPIGFIDPTVKIPENEIAPCTSNELSVPNVFTPNNDGVNDLFFPMASPCLSIQKMTILNRWGNLMYSMENPLPFWDGTNSENIPASEGTYFWIIEYLDVKGNLQSINGYLTLVTN